VNVPDGHTRVVRVANRLRRHGARHVPNSFPVVCIGMSNGGVKPLLTLFRHLGPSTGMAFVVVHYLQDIPTLLPEVLPSHTSIPVQSAATDRILLPNHIYVVPSSQEMILTNGFFLTRPWSKRGWSNVFTVFLDSLSRSRHHGVAVVLSRLDEGGVAALKMFQQRGGITIAQTPESAEEPSAAIKTRYVDYVLEPEAIARRLKQIARSLRR